VADGAISAKSMDAINGSQLWDYTLNTNNILSSTNLYTSIAGLSTNLGTLTAGAVQYATNTDGSVNYDLITLAGTNGTKITNLMAGDISQDSMDAINGGQLWHWTLDTDNQLSNTNLYNQIVNNYTSITNIENDVANNYTAITNNAAGIANNYASITNIKNDVANNYTAITNLEANVDALAQSVHGHNGTGIDSAVLWTNDVASGDYSTALGGASATAERSTAVGHGASASGVHSSAFGEGADASEAYSTAVGGESAATAENASAFGHKAVASHENSVAIGANSETSGKDTVSIGSKGNERRLTNVADGKDGMDAVNMKQFGELQNDVKKLDSKIDKAYGGIAAVAAIPPLVPPSAPGKTTCQGGAAYYEGEYAVGVNLTHRLKGKVLEDHRVFVNGGVAVSSEDTVVTRAVVGFEF
jgi:autotransporter adhesin